MKKWLLIALLAMSGIAQAAIVEGKDYKVLPQAHKVANPAKIEVLEIFSYTCIHCYKLDPYLMAYEKKPQPDVDFRTAHVMWGKSLEGFAKLLATIELTKTSNVLRKPAFDAVMNQKINLGNPTVLAGWLKSQRGVDANKFMATYNSFAVNTTLARYTALTKEYDVKGTPMIIVAGKYEVIPAADPSRMVQVVSELIAKERQARKATKK